MATFHIGSLDGRLGCTVSELLLPNITSVSCEGMVERGAIDVLRMQRKVIANHEDRSCASRDTAARAASDTPVGPGGIDGLKVNLGEGRELR